MNAKTVQRLTLLLALALCTSCQLTAERGERTIAFYDLGTPTTSEILPCCGGQVALAPIRAAAMLDSQTMWYRKGSDSVHPRAFAISRWSADPAALVEQYVRVALSIADPERRDALPYRLSLKLESMEQHFPVQGPSRARLVVSATLTRTDDRKVLSSRVFSLVREARADTPEGGAEALAALAESLVADLQAWVCEHIHEDGGHSGQRCAA